MPLPVACLALSAAAAGCAAASPPPGHAMTAKVIERTQVRIAPEGRAVGAVGRFTEYGGRRVLRVVERRGAPPEAQAHDVVAPPGEQGVRLPAIGPTRAVAARVADRDLRDDDGRDAGRAGASDQGEQGLARARLGDLRRAVHP